MICADESIDWVIFSHAGGMALLIARSLFLCVSVCPPLCSRLKYFKLCAESLWSTEDGSVWLLRDLLFVSHHHEVKLCVYSKISQQRSNGLPWNLIDIHVALRINLCDPLSSFFFFYWTTNMSKFSLFLSCIWLKIQHKHSCSSDEESKCILFLHITLLERSLADSCSFYVLVTIKGEVMAPKSFR